MQIYVFKHGQPTGPFTKEQVQQKIGAGEFSSNDLCWHEGIVNWTPAALIPGVVPQNPGLPAAMPPLPVGMPQPFAQAQPGVSILPAPTTITSRVDNTIVWIAAFLPLAYLIPNAIAKEMDISTWFVVPICILINGLVLAKDQKNLKAAGFPTQVLDALGPALLVPVYMFKRPRLVGGGYGYAICWVVTFVLSLL